MKSTLKLAFIPIALAVFVGTAAAEEHPATLTGGHDIGKGDYGRPCVLIAAALGVKTEVFREAFGGVTPAKDGKPSEEEAKRNKEALMKVLKPHGVTNERLDEVSNYYRFKPQDGKLWKHAEAKVHAVVEDGRIKEVVIVEAGSGYTVPPKLTVKGFEKVEFVVTLHFDKDMAKNGSIKSIEVKK